MAWSKAQHKSVRPYGRTKLHVVQVVIVEDFLPIREIIRSVLDERAEYRIVGEASDGLEAVQKIRELQPDLVLLDIGLPNLNGVEVAERVRTIAPHAKLLFVSQESSSAVIDETFRVGGQGYVYKACVPRDLAPAIEAALGGKRFVSGDLSYTSDVEPGTPDRHEIAFCSSDGVVLEMLACFIGEALNAGNPAIVWATEPHQKTLVEQLRAEGVEIDLALQRGTYVSRDVSEVADVVGLLEVLTALAGAASRLGTEHPRIAVCGERAGRLWAEGKFDEAIRLEQLWNQIAATRNDLDILCVYPTPSDTTDDQVFTTVCLEHNVVQAH